jgi:hypothetical protein
VRNKQAQDTSVSITRGARIVKGRLPAVDHGVDSVLQWKLSTEAMKQAMLNGTYTPFEAALEKGLVVHRSSLKHSIAEASALLSRRRLYRADGAAVRNSAAGDAASAPFLALMQKVVDHMVGVSELTLQDVANYEMCLFFNSCLLGTATLRDQAYRKNVIDDVYMDENGFICESIFEPLQLKVKASASESGHLLVADVKPRECTLAWLMMVCAVRPMRAVLHAAVPGKQIWGMSGIDNSIVSRSAWAQRIQGLSRLHLGSPRTGIALCKSLNLGFQYSIDVLAEQAARGLCSNVYLLLVEVFAVALNIVLLYQSQTTGHGVYRLMCITTKIYDIRRQYGGITEPRARSALLSHAHRCNTSLDTMLVSAHAIAT